MHLISDPSDGTVMDVSELMRLIQAHRDRYGVTQAEFARRAGTTPQTVNNWRHQIRRLPDAVHLAGVAEVTGVPYPIVLDAALVDAGYRDSMADDAVTLRARLRCAVEADPGVLDDVAAVVAELRAEQGIAAAPAGLEDAEARAAADLIARLIRREFNRDDGDDGGHQAS